MPFAAAEGRGVRREAGGRRADGPDARGRPANLLKRDPREGLVPAKLPDGRPPPARRIAAAAFAVAAAAAASADFAAATAAG